MARDVTLHAKMTRRKRRTSSRLRTRVIFCPCADAWVVRLSGPTSHVRRADLQFCNPNTQSCIRHFYWTFIAPHPCISFLFRWTFISFKSTTVPTFSTSGRGNPTHISVCPTYHPTFYTPSAQEVPENANEKVFAAVRPRKVARFTPTSNGPTFSAKEGQLTTRSRSPHIQQSIGTSNHSISVAISAHLSHESCGGIHLCHFAAFVWGPFDARTRSIQAR
jgi:hypothetical protein